MKCYRVLYTPDNTAFMVWETSEENALKKVRPRNCKELPEGTEESQNDYIVDVFTPETNGTGILAFYDVYTTFNRE